MAKKSQFVVGLELGQDSCKLVALQPEPRQIETVGLTWVDASWRKGSAEMGQGVQGWIADLKLDKNVKAAAACVSGVNAQIRLIEVDPAMPLEDAIRYEIRAWSGKPDSEWWINVLGQQGTGPNGQPAYLVVASPKALVQDAAAICQWAGLPLQEIGVDIVGVHNAFEATCPAWSDRLVALLLAQGRSLQIWWTQDRRFLGHAVLTIPPEQSPDALALEAGRALNEGVGLLQGNSGSLAGVFAAGDLAAEPGFLAKIASGLRTEVRPLDGFASIPFPSAEGMLSQLAETAPKCAVAVGLALPLVQGDRS